MKNNQRPNNFKLTIDQIVKCNAIIHSNAAATAAIALPTSQIPVPDAAIITPIQTTMIIELGRVFDIEITANVASGILKSLGAMVVGRQTVKIALGWFPGIGNIINTTTAAGVTEAIGWLTVKEFRENMRKYYKGYDTASKIYETKFNKQKKDFDEKIQAIKKSFKNYK